MKVKKNKKKRASLNEICKDINLPYNYPWKVLGKLIDDLHYLLTREEIDIVSTIIRKRDHVGYLQLSEEWGIQSNYLKDRPLANVRAVYQVISLLKKFTFGSHKEERMKAAMKKFIQGEQACKEFNETGYRNLVSPKEEWITDVFTYAKSFVEKLLGFSPPDDDSLTEWSRHGPGSNLDTNDGLINKFSKYENWPYSCTQDAFVYARFQIQSDPRWLGALEDSYRKAYGIKPWEIIDQRMFWQQVLWIVPGNRITFVPKNALTERSIAIEPAMNLHLQLGIDGYFRRKLKRWGIDLDDQTKNQELARLGSLLGTYATLDLKGASDAISTRIVKLLFPKDWYDLLMALRSPYGEYKGKSALYEKISSMGNGYTFALESVIFASIVYGVQMRFNGEYDANECAVYGDDLIVPTALSQATITALTSCGFSLNEEKSFVDGPFRESCGADWFHGKQIRPVFLTSIPEHASTLFNDFNRLKRVLNMRWEIEESEVLKQIHKWIPVPLWGLHGPVSDEEFGTYVHVNQPVTSVDSGMYKFSRLNLKSVSRRFPRHTLESALAGSYVPDSFLFGKLMDELRVNHTSKNKWDSRYIRGVKLNAKGSKFALSDNRLFSVSVKVSAVSNWPSEYREVTPVWQRSQKAAKVAILG
jgi:hypothetical protein